MEKCEFCGTTEQELTAYGESNFLPASLLCPDCLTDAIRSDIETDAIYHAERIFGA